jgi:N utilization substance protein A
VDIIDAQARVAQVIVPDYQLSLAIGKEGQNARLAARLTGWRIDIRPDRDPAAPSADSVSPAAGPGSPAERAGPAGRRGDAAGPVAVPAAADAPAGSGAGADTVPGAADAPAL